MTAITAGGAHRKSRAVEAAGRVEPIGSLVRVRRIGYAVLGLQLIGFMVWSAILADHFALTYDFAIYGQAWYLIAHGHLDPVSTIQQFPFWQNHSEFIMWPLAPLYWLWPHPSMLLWVQDAAVVGAQIVAFSWICEMCERGPSQRQSKLLAYTGLVLLAMTPWIWWSISWDFHFESIVVLFATLLARDLWRGRRRAWLWVVPLLACGDVSCTYLIGLGMGGVLARRGRLGAAIAATGLAAFAVITAVHGNVGSGHGLREYAYLAGAGTTGAAATFTSVPSLAIGIIRHPLGILRVLWAKRLDIWGDVTAPGLLGLGFLWLLPIAMVALLENALWPGVLFVMPSFQNMVLYVLLPVGTVGVLAGLMRRRPRLALLLAAVIATQATGWAVVWAPRTANQWLRVSSAAAATLSSVAARIPPSASVVASQGVVGGFAGRLDIRPLLGQPTVPVAGETWFVIVPAAGIEVQSTAGAMGLISELSGPLHAHLVVHANGVWAFRWAPSPRVHEITVPDQPAMLDAWTSPGAAGRDVLAGPARGWHVTSTGQRGYVADGLQWQENPGGFVASAAVSASGPVNVEVWNDNCDALLARRSVPATSGIQSVTIPVRVAVACSAPVFSGWGPFRASMIAPPPGQRLEVRVWSPGHERVSVYSVSLIPVASG